MLGTNLGSYTILRKLGEGGMGEVYLAAHRRLARLAAVKVLLPECSTNADVVSRFFTEARATSLLDHPGIVEILDCDVHPSGRAYIVMEYLRGEGLAACIRRVGDLGTTSRRCSASVNRWPARSPRRTTRESSTGISSPTTCTY